MVGKVGGLDLALPCQRVGGADQQLQRGVQESFGSDPRGIWLAGKARKEASRGPDPRLVDT